MKKKSLIGFTLIFILLVLSQNSFAASYATGNSNTKKPIMQIYVNQGGVKVFTDGNWASTEPSPIL